MSIPGASNMNQEKDISLNKLFLLLRHRDIETRWKAAVSISRCGSKAVEPLLMHMYDDDPNIRILSIWALGRIRDGRAIGPISRSIHDENELIRLASEGALSRIIRAS
jgi:bilin biosynthesis protein